MIAAVGAVVEDQQIAAGQRARVVLLGERRAAERPDDLAGGALDHDHRRDVAEAHHDVAIGRLGDGVAVGPLGAAVLRRDGVGLGIEMFPAPPLPHGLAPGRRFQEIVGVDHAVDLGTGQAAPHASRHLGGQRAQAQEQHVAVAEPPGVVMVIRVLQLPDDAPAPIHFQYGAALEAGPRLEPSEVLGDLPAVEEMTVVEQVPVEAGPVGQPPRVGEGAVHVQQVHGAVTQHRREERVARLGARGIVGDEPGPRTPDLLLIDRHAARGAQKPRRRPARASSGAPIETTPSLVRPVE